MRQKYSKDFLLSLYTTMLRIRLCEESLVEPILSGEIKTPCHLYTGEEAIATGVCACLTQKDYIFGNHRSHGHYIAKGGDLRSLVAEIYCKETGCCKGRGGSMHVISPSCGLLGAAPIVAGTISLAMGAALASQLRGEDRVCVSFFGDGATGEGVFYESLNFASLKRLPIIFACENNLYSTHMPISECRSNVNIFESASSFLMQGFQVDGNDVIEVYEKTKDAVSLCRKGEGPVLIEFLTYRLRGHVGPDDNIQGTHTDIRPDEEVRRWKKKDPITRLETFLLEENRTSSSELDEIRERIMREVEEAHIFAKQSDYPIKEELNKYVFRQ